jgi:ABC-2 type transport system ATP-binding protein
VTEYVIETMDLRKSYDGVEALRGLSLAVPKGSVFGFLGKNGAGKTTTIKVLLGLVQATGGTARVFGLPVESPAAGVDIRRRVGFVADEKALIDQMTVQEIVAFTRRFYPRWRDDLEQRYLRTFDLPVLRTVKQLSRGMRTKLALLLALCRGAELLILDEPTSGLDPAVTEEVLQAIVGHVANEELTVFFSSHQIAEVDQISDRVAIIDRGRVLVAGELDDLRERYRRIQFVFENEAPNHRFGSRGVERTLRKGRVISVLASAGIDDIIAEGRVLGATSVDAARVTLKDIFLETVAAED